MLSWFWVSAGMNVVGWVYLLTVMLKPNNDDERRFSRRLSFSCHVAVSDVAPVRGMKGEGGSPLLVVATCVRCCCGFEEPVLVGTAFGDGW